MILNNIASSDFSKSCSFNLVPKGLKKEQNNVKLTYRMPKDLRFMAVAESSYGTDKLKRRSISGVIYIVGGTITDGYLKAQTHNTLSSSEAKMQHWQVQDRS